MPRENKSLPELRFTDFDIDGNVFRAWRDDAGTVVFVRDDTIDEFKPNVMLVLSRHDDRKWDDILVNDYGVDLENVRPKVDNKYQKLDIEYSGLDVYAQLIDEYENGADDLDSIISDLIDFRDTASRRAAMARLVAATDEIAMANDTIARTENSIKGLRERRRKLREKLAAQREKIGREAPKESASKILRIEAQIETVSEKLARAEKRLENAQRRIEVATEEANAARELLARTREVATDDVPEFTVPAANRGRVAKQKITEIQESEIDDADDAYNADDSDEEIDDAEDAESEKADDTESDDAPVQFPVPEHKYKPQPRDEEMAEQEEVKPLLDEDPEILDEEIAFKPVGFDDIKPRDVENVRPRSPYDTDDAKKETVSQEEYRESVRMDTESDSGTARPLDFSNVENVTEHDSYQDAPTPREEPVINTIKTVEEPRPMDVDTTGNTTNAQYENTNVVRPAPTRPEVATNTYVRPLSPISGNAPVRPVGESRNRSSFAYYLLLILLIGLSIFTLWLYQKKNGATVPMLNAPAAGIIEEAPKEDVAPIVEKQNTPSDLPVVEPIPESVPEPAPEPEPDVPVVADEPINIVFPNENVLRAAEPDTPVVEPEEDVLGRKDAYDVARDKPIYVPVPEPRVTNVTAPDVIFDDDIISVPTDPVDYGASENYVVDENMYYQNQDGAYYDENAQYDEQYNQYDQYVDETGGFVSEPEREPETTRHLSIHDGGQYSIGYTETTY